MRGATVSARRWAVMGAAALALGALWWWHGREDGGPTGAAAELVTPRRLARAGAALLIADPDAQRVFRLEAGGLAAWAGSGDACTAHCCDDAPAGAPLAYPSDVVLLPSGDALVANTRASCVVRVDREGRRWAWLGQGRRGRPQATAATPLRQAALDEPEALLVMRDGRVLVADAALCQVLAVSGTGADATVVVFAGGGRCGFAGDGGPAAAAALRAPAGLLEGRDGAVYIADTDNSRVRRVERGGRISTVAGSGVRGSSPLPGRATAAALNEPEGLLEAPDGALIILDTDNSRVLALRGEQLELLAPTQPDDGLRYPKGGLVEPDGALLVADTDNARLVRVAGPPGAARVLAAWPLDAAPRFEAHDGALDTVERERRIEALRAAPPAQQAELFRALTEDLELDDADRALRWETLGAQPLEAFEALLKRATRRPGG